MAEQWIANLRLEELNGISLLVRVILCIVLGGILGMERTRKRRPAGMRTYMLVCLGSAAAMMTGIYMYDAYGGGFDPSRIAAQVVTGVGFLGAGTILTTRYHRVKGLTTAAGLWVAACLGLAIGAGWYLGSVVIALASLFIMADAVGRSGAAKILIPSQQCNIRLAIGKYQPMKYYLDEAARLFEEEIGNLTGNQTE